MALPTVADEWASYERAVLPPGVSAVQRTETRRAFYAGCRAMMTLALNVAPDAVSEDEGAAYLGRLEDELTAFNERVKAGKA